MSAAALGGPTIVAVGLGLVVAAGGGIYWAMKRLGTVDEDFEKLNREFDDFFTKKGKDTDISEADLRSWANGKKLFGTVENLSWTSVCREVSSMVQKLGEKAQGSIKSYCDKTTTKDQQTV